MSLVKLVIEMEEDRGLAAASTGKFEAGAATEKAIKDIGGEMRGYYFGLTNGRNYIIAALPDGRTAQAMLIQRLATTLVVEYEAIELVESSEMPAVFGRLKELETADKSLK